MSKVKLVWATPDAEKVVAYCARVSNPKNQDNDNIDKLLSYCVKHKHWSIFEMVSACFEIETTRDIARQILRHRSFSFQEFSQRYADPTVDLGSVVREARLQDLKNRQNSIDSSNGSLSALWDIKQTEVIQKAKDVYNWAIDNGIAKEQARVVLPEGNTVSRMYMSGNLRSWMHYVTLRSGVETQKEHREIAKQIGVVCNEVFPVSWSALCNTGSNS